MIVPDSNLLLYAYNVASPYHDGAKTWWESVLSGAESVGLTHPVLFSFVRVGTSTNAFPTPYTLAEVETIINEWMDHSLTRLLAPGPTHVADTIDLLKRAGSAGGNLTTDAQIAATAKAHNATVHTADRDFMRFPELKCHYPLSAA